MSGGGTSREAKPALNPTALPVADAARLLSAAGGQRVTVEMLQADIDAGAPTNADGTINLVQYAAWLVAQAVRPFDRSTVQTGGRGATGAGERSRRDPDSPTAEQSNSLRAGGSHD